MIDQMEQLCSIWSIESPKMTITSEHILKEVAKVLANTPNASLAEIAQAIGIGRTTLHRHFAKREDLIRALTLYSLKLVDDAMRPIQAQNLPPQKALYAVFNVLIPMGEHFHFLSQEYAVMDDAEISHIYHRQLTELSELVQSARNEGLIATDIPVAWIVRMIDSIVYTAWEAIEAGDIARNDATDLVFRTLMDGITKQEELR